MKILNQIKDILLVPVLIIWFILKITIVKPISRLPKYIGGWHDLIWVAIITLAILVFLIDTYYDYNKESTEQVTQEVTK
jgi:hypothetical protein